MSNSLLQHFHSVLEYDLFTTAASAAGLAVIFHQSILRHVELDLYMYHFLALGIVATLSLAASYLVLTDFSIVEGLIRTAIVTASFNSGLLLSIGVYRLFFHRLRNFPGPLPAKLSRFYAVALAAKNVQLYKEIAKLHNKYGDFIRTGPREICIVRKSAIQTLYGPQSECLKSTWYSQATSDDSKASIHMTRDFGDHKRRRKAWDRGFAIKALNTYEPRIKQKVDLFCRQLASHAAADKPIDATAWSMYLSFDIMGEVGFGKDFGGLANGTEHPAIKGIHEHMAVLGVLSNVPWLLNLASSIPGATAGYAGFFGWCASEIEAKQKQWNAHHEPEDIVAWLLQAFNEKDVSAAPSEEALHEDSRVVIIAGSETTATSIATILYYLARYPEVVAKIRSQVDALPEASYENIKTITYIDNVINETMRLKPALLTGGYRVTPPKGIEVDGVYIPGDTNVFVPIQLIQTDQRYFDKPLDFIPDRWAKKIDGPFIPFSHGAYSCPGKNLALMSLRLALSSVVQQFDVSFAEGETGEKFDEALDTFTTTLAPLMLKFTPRK